MGVGVLFGIFPSSFYFAGVVRPPRMGDGDNTMATVAVLAQGKWGWEHFYHVEDGGVGGDVGGWAGVGGFYRVEEAGSAARGKRCVIPVIRPVIRCKTWVIRVIHGKKRKNL